MAFLRFVASSTGRVVRAIVGTALLFFGWLTVGGTGGLVIGLVGAILVLVGLFDVCLLGPAIGTSFSGAKVRELTRRNARTDAEDVASTADLSRVAQPPLGARESDPVEEIERTGVKPTGPEDHHPAAH